MKLTITTNDGEVLTIIEDIELYNFDKPFARVELIDEIKRAIRKGEGC